MAPDPRSPVLVGVGQVRGGTDADAVDASGGPIALFTEAAHAAERDAGAALLRRVDLVASVLIGTAREPDPGAAVALELGIEPRATMLATIGGNTPQLMVNELADRISRNRLDVALIGGAEAVATRARRRAAGEGDFPVHDTNTSPERIGDENPGTSNEEMAHGLVMPVTVYPLFESALRSALGHGVVKHQAHVAQLWASFSEVAARNPFAWDRNASQAGEISKVSDENRVVCWPYTKRMCARPKVDLGAALILCSLETARAAGVADDRIVFLHAGADAHDHWFPTTRWSLADSPAIRAVGSAALEAAGASVDDVARFDLYSCFPSAVQQAQRALGIAGPSGGDGRPITVTGGLGFAGGPLNNYVMHSIAAMADECRRDPGSLGVTTAIGWYITKHSMGVWSTTPPAHSYRRVDPTITQAAVDALPSRKSAGEFDGSAVVDASQVRFDREGNPEQATVTAITDDGRRALAISTDADLMQSMVDDAWEGRRIDIVSTPGSPNFLKV